MASTVQAAIGRATGFEDLVERFMAWGQGRDDVRGIAVFGSRARPDGPNDEWSDLDLIVVAADPSALLDDAGWLEEIARPWVTLVHESPVPRVHVRQVLFDGAFDMDIVPLAPGTVTGLVADPGMVAVFAQGFRPVLDRDGELAAAVDALDAASEAPAEPALPDEREFPWTVRDFLFQCVWATKKLLRGELWVAEADCDGYLKEHLLRMIAWHAAATGTARDRIRPDGRYLERWAAQGVVDRLGSAFARYDRDDVAGALLRTMDLFRDLATETAQALRFEYPHAEDLDVSGWVRDRLAAA